MFWKLLARRDPRSGRFLLVFVPFRVLGVVLVGFVSRAKLHRVVRVSILGLKEGKFPVIPCGFLLKRDLLGKTQVSVGCFESCCLQ